MGEYLSFLRNTAFDHDQRLGRISSHSRIGRDMDMISGCVVGSTRLWILVPEALNSELLNPQAEKPETLKPLSPKAPEA